MTFDEFLHEYLGAHLDRRTQVVHAIGTIGALSLLAAAIVLRKPKLAIVAIVAGYFPAWLSHFVIEGNTPMSFSYPLYSLRADLVMAYRLLTGEAA